MNKLIANHSDELDEYRLTTVELNALYDIREFLGYAHSVQELVSAEQTPTLCIVISLYEQLIQKLEDAKYDLPKLAHALNAAIAKLQEYLPVLLPESEDLQPGHWLVTSLDVLTIDLLITDTSSQPTNEALVDSEELELAGLCSCSEARPRLCEYQVLSSSKAFVHICTDA